MITWPRVRTALGYLLTLVLMISTVIAVQSQSVDTEPSAEGRLSAYYSARRMALYPGDSYPTYPGDNLPLYPGDEKWDGQYSAVRPYPGDIKALATDGEYIYAGGFGYLPGDYQATSYLAQWKGESWKDLAAGAYGPVEGEIHALAYQNNQLYVGGYMNQAGGVPIQNIASWNGTSWNDMNGGLSSVSGYAGVLAVAASGPDVYAGGFFDLAGKQTVNNIAHWDGAQWLNMGTGVSSTVYAIAVNGSNVYVGGTFNQAGDVQNVSNIAVWNGTTWAELGSGVNGPVFAIAVQGSDVYVGGSFTYAGGIPVNGIARWDGSQWHALGNGLPNIYGYNNANVKAIKVTPQGVYAGGYFESSTRAYRAYSIAFWDGTSWTNLGSGLRESDKVDSGEMNALEILNNQVFTAGFFQLAGNDLSQGFAIWNNAPAADNYEVGSDPVAPGSLLSLVARWFPGKALVKLTIHSPNGEVVTKDLLTNEDGKVYVRLMTGATSPLGEYTFTFSTTSAGASTAHNLAGSEITASGSFILVEGAPLYISPWAGSDVPYTDFYLQLPVIRR